MFTEPTALDYRNVPTQLLREMAPQLKAMNSLYADSVAKELARREARPLQVEPTLRNTSGDENWDWNDEISDYDPFDRDDEDDD